MIGDPSWAWARSGGAMAARPGQLPRAFKDRNDLIGSLAISAVPLALLDPDAARTVLERAESLGGIDLVSLPEVRESWLTAWALVNLAKAAAIFESELASLDQGRRSRVRRTDFFEMIELLVAPADRREDVLRRRSSGAVWPPAGP